MTRLERALRDIRTALPELGKPMALVGGLAVSARTEPRFTRDVDVAVAVGSDTEAEQLIFELQARGYRATDVVEHTGVHRLATARLVPPTEDEPGVVVDLLFASSGIEPEIVAEAQELEIFPGLTLPVARIGHLIAAKLLSRDDQDRPTDAADLRALRSVMGSSEQRRAEDAVRLIMKRGFHRGRPLDEHLRQWLSSGTG